MRIALEHRLSDETRIKNRMTAREAKAIECNFVSIFIKPLPIILLLKILMFRKKH